MALISLGGFAHQTLSVTVITMASDLFRRSEVATVGYTPFFVCPGILDLVGAAVLWTLVREPRGETAAAVATRS